MTDARPEAPPRPGLLASLRRLAATLVDILQTRLELVATELEEERARLRDLLVYGLLTLFFVSMTMIMITAYVVILYWETQRLNVIGAFAALYGGAGLVTGFILWRTIRFRPRLFSSSLSELKKDKHQLHEPDS